MRVCVHYGPNVNIDLNAGPEKSREAFLLYHYVQALHQLQICEGKIINVKVNWHLGCDKLNLSTFPDLAPSYF